VVAIGASPEAAWAGTTPSPGSPHAPTNSRQIQHWTLNLPIRLREHAAGRGARLMQVVAEQGIGWQVTACGSAAAAASAP
jgi:hypothetical protein